MVGQSHQGTSHYHNTGAGGGHSGGEGRENGRERNRVEEGRRKVRRAMENEIKT